MTKTGKYSQFFAAAAFAALAGPAFAGGLFGKIDLVKSDGSDVYGIHFENPNDVYLIALRHGGDDDSSDDDSSDDDGGGGSCSGKKLPNGEYYFQVTDPPGNVLLSTDDISQRKVRIEHGVIVEYLGQTHQLGVGICHPDAIGIQLMPFDPTPNPGGVHRVWLTRVQDYSPNTPNSVFGFKHNKSKTANFKAPACPPPPPPCEPCDPPGGGPAFVSTIVINAYYDANANGVNDGELPIDGLMFDVITTPPGGPQMTQTAATSSDGVGQALIDVPAGSLVIVAARRPGSGNDDCQWTQFEPNVATANALPFGIDWCYMFITQSQAASVTTLPLGMACLCEPYGGRDIAYWSGEKGKRILEKKDIKWRKRVNKLDLRRTNGTDYDVPMEKSFPTAFNHFRNWLVNSQNAGNLSRQLSAELAATRMTIDYKALDKRLTVLVPANHASTLGLTGNTMTINQAATLAKWSITSDPLVVLPGFAFEYQNALVEVLRQINSDQLPFVSTDPCPVLY